jgi:glycine dehydrogenase subunit 2
MANLCGMLCIRPRSRCARARTDGHPGSRKRAWHQSGDRGLCRVPVESIPATPEGRVDLAALKAKLGPHVAGVMITNPNTCGLFERDMKAISDAVHAAGGYVYCDGANFNAIVGKVRPGDPGVDAMHINLHKTFSTPHGGGGPGSGPVVLSEALSPLTVRCPFTARCRWQLQTGRGGIGGRGCIHGLRPDDRVSRPDGHVHPRAGLYPQPRCRRPEAGGRGCGAQRQLCAAQPAKDVLEAPFAASGPCMHEALFSDAGLAEGFSTLDIAKGLIDEGFHPMTVYFPLVVMARCWSSRPRPRARPARPLHRLAALAWRSGRKAGDPRAQERAALRPAPSSRRNAGGAQAGAGLERG